MQVSTDKIDCVAVREGVGVGDLPVAKSVAGFLHVPKLQYVVLCRLWIQRERDDRKLDGNRYAGIGPQKFSERPALPNRLIALEETPSTPRCTSSCPCTSRLTTSRTL